MDESKPEVKKMDENKPEVDFYERNGFAYARVNGKEYPFWTGVDSQISTFECISLYLSCTLLSLLVVYYVCASYANMIPY